MQSKKASYPTERDSAGAAERPLDFDVLAGRLHSIALRAAAERWRGWTPEDAKAVEEAERAIRAIPDALAASMREGFAIGRRYGQEEEHLAGLNMQINALARHVARQAWGGGHPGLA